MYYEKLSQNELDMIKRYIRSYATEDYSEPIAPLSHILRHWDEAKSGYLSTLFKEQLIVSYPVEFEEGFSEIMDKLDTAIYQDSRCMTFIENINARQKKKIKSNFQTA